jgi:hypothetical protein
MSVTELENMQDTWSLLDSIDSVILSKEREAVVLKGIGPVIRTCLARTCSVCVVI